MLFLTVFEVDAVTIMRDPSGTSRGFAFLTFEDPSAVQVVTAQDHFLDGKAVCFFLFFCWGWLVLTCLD